MKQDREVTALFLDIKGYIRLSQRTGRGWARLGRRGFRIGPAELPLLCGMPGGALDRAIRGLDVLRQPLLPPFVLRARGDCHRPIGRPVERNAAIREGAECEMQEVRAWREVRRGARHGSRLAV